MNQTIVCARPDYVDVFVRRSDGVDDSSWRHIREVGRSKDSDALRHLCLGPRQIGTDRLPTGPSGSSLEQYIPGKVENLRIKRRKEDGRSPKKAVFAASHCFGRDILHLSRSPVVSTDLAAVDDVRIQRVGRHVAILFGADRMPLPKRDLPIVAPACNSYRTALLLAAVDPVWKLIVGADVVKLRRRLVVPGTPAFTPVDGDDRALIARYENDSGIFGIDPQRMVVVAARRSAKGRKRMSAIGRFPRDNVGVVDHVRVLRIYFQ